MFVDGKPIPFSVNSTISYSSEDKQNGSLYNKVRVSTVDISRSRQTDVLEISSTALVEKGVWSIKKIVFLLWKQHGAGEVSHFLAYFDKFTTSLKIQVLSLSESILCFDFVFCSRLTNSRYRRVKVNCVILGAPTHISNYVLTSPRSRLLRKRTERATETRERMLVLWWDLHCLVLHVYKRSRVFFGWQFSRPTRTVIPSGAS